MFGPKGPFCGSCGMPLSKEFTEPNLTAAQMIAKVKGKMRAMHFPGFIANYFTKSIPKLRRWNASESAR